MNGSDKITAYNKLVDEIKNCKLLSECNGGAGVRLEKCSMCREVNLWSYWQGGAEHLDARILLVGQDWGVFDNSDGRAVLDNIKSGRFYMDGNENPTDKNLCELFKSIGEDIGPSFVKNKNVFFTNFVLCYRTADNSISKGFRQRWAKNCSAHFKKLVAIIEPEVIICLGRNVFKNVMKSADLKIPHKRYNDIIEMGGVSVSFGEHRCMVFPEAHCGTLGTNNRNRGQTFSNKLDVLKNDWQRIKDYL